MFVSAVEKHFTKFRDMQLNEEIYRMINVFLNQISERFRNIERNDLLSQATILDPRFKKFGFSDENNANFAIENIKKKFLPFTQPVQLFKLITLI